VALHGRGRSAQFIPIRFIFRNKLTRDDRLLVAFDVLVLSEFLGHGVNQGKIIHGDACGTLKVKTEGLLGQVRKLTAKMAEVVASGSPPDLVLNRRCGECEFQARRRQKAIEKDDLSLLASMSEKERKKLRSKGIFTVTQLSYTFRPRRRPEELKQKREKYHHSLKALAIRKKKIHIVGSAEPKIEGIPVYLDVEGLPDRDFYYLIGVRIGNGELAIQHSLWADTAEEEARIWREFLGILETIEKPVLVYYGSYEKTFLNSMCERHGKPPESSAVTEAVRSGVNLLSVIFAHIYFPTYSNGLKDIAHWLGFNWSGEDASGVQSIIWRDEWERTKAPRPKEQLITYNSEDCGALEIVARIVSRACKCNEESNSAPTEPLEVVVADNLDSKLTMWPRFNSSIEGFEAINKAARWDYQRDRIYVRTDGQLRRAKRKVNNQGERPVRIAKVVICERPRVCLRCQKRGGQMLRTVTKHLHDLRFTRSGIIGWVVKYQFQVVWCKNCSAFTPWPKEFWGRSKYGRNLAAFIIFGVCSTICGLFSVVFVMFHAVVLTA
jgi:predicted RecB family nuclease